MSDTHCVLCGTVIVTEALCKYDCRLDGLYADERERYIDEHPAELRAALAAANKQIEAKDKRIAELEQTLSEVRREYAAMSHQAVSKLAASAQREQELQLEIREAHQAYDAVLRVSKAVEARVQELRGQVEHMDKLYVHPDPSVPNPCTICGFMIYGSYIGDGDGSMRDGGRFAHPECYRERELKSRLSRLLKEGGELVAEGERYAKTPHINLRMDEDGNDCGQEEYYTWEQVAVGQFVEKLKTLLSSVEEK